MNHSKNDSNQNSESASSRRQFLRKILRTSIAVSVIQSLQIKKVYAQFFTTAFWKKRGNAIGGSIFSFGFNTNGELGDSSVVAKSSPVQIGALTDWLSVSAGRVQTTAIKTDGSLWSWGKSSYLGISAAGTKSSPVQIGTATDWLKVSSGDSSAMAIKTDGSLWGWGSNGSNFPLGTGVASGTLSSPVQVGTDTNWSKVSVGFYGGLAVKTNGTLWTWGYNYKGRLGLMPTAFGQMWSPSGWSQLVAGATGGFVRQTDGTL